MRSNRSTFAVLRTSNTPPPTHTHTHKGLDASHTHAGIDKQITGFGRSVNRDGLLNIEAKHMQVLGLSAV